MKMWSWDTKSTVKLHIFQILPRILLDQVNMRLNPYLNQKDFRFVTFLDPRFKADWLQTDEERALLKEASIQSTKELLKRKAAIKVDSCERSFCSNHNQNSSSSDSEEKGMVNTGLFSFIPLARSRKKRKIASGLTEENILRDSKGKYSKKSSNCLMNSHFAAGHFFANLPLRKSFLVQNYKLGFVSFRKTGSLPIF